MHFHERRQAQLPTASEQLSQFGVRQRRYDEQHGIGAGGAGLQQLEFGRQEVLPQHRD